MGVLTDGKRTPKCSDVGLLQLDVSNRHPISIEVLVVEYKLLGFDLLFRFDTIKKLGGCVCD